VHRKNDDWEIESYSLVSMDEGFADLKLTKEEKYTVKVTLSGQFDKQVAQI
jgi:hypothetical protein